MDSFDALSDIMIRNGFALKATEEMPFVIREHARKFQWGCAKGSVWVKQLARADVVDSAPTSSKKLK